MDTIPMKILPGPAVMLGNSILRLSATEGLAAAEKLARAAYRGILREELAAFDEVQDRA